MSPEVLAKIRAALNWPCNYSEPCSCCADRYDQELIALLDAAPAPRPFPSREEFIDQSPLDSACNGQLEWAYDYLRECQAPAVEITEEEIAGILDRLGSVWPPRAVAVEILRFIKSRLKPAPEVSEDLLPSLEASLEAAHLYRDSLGDQRRQISQWCIDDYGQGFLEGARFLLAALKPRGGK